MLIASRFVPGASSLRFDRHHEEISATKREDVAVTVAPGASLRRFKDEDSAGFWIETRDGTIWAPGDFRFIPKHHLRMPVPDALLFDFSE